MVFFQFISSDENMLCLLTENHCRNINCDFLLSLFSRLGHSTSLHLERIWANSDHTYCAHKTQYWLRTVECFRFVSSDWQTVTECMFSIEFLMEFVFFFTNGIPRESEMHTSGEHRESSERSCMTWRSYKQT